MIQKLVEAIEDLNNEEPLVAIYGEELANYIDIELKFDMMLGYVYCTGWYIDHHNEVEYEYETDNGCVPSDEEMEAKVDEVANIIFNMCKEPLKKIGVSLNSFDVYDKYWWTGSGTEEDECYIYIKLKTSTFVGMDSSGDESLRIEVENIIKNKLESYEFRKEIRNIEADYEYREGCHEEQILFKGDFKIQEFDIDFDPSQE